MRNLFRYSILGRRLEPDDLLSETRSPMLSDTDRINRLETIVSRLLVELAETNQTKFVGHTKVINDVINPADRYTIECEKN